MGIFATTRWSLVARAGQSDGVNKPALEQLCQIYRPVVFNWFRYRGLAPEAADDLTQSFFAKLMERNMLAVADPERGRFRTFLGTSLKNFYSHEREREQAQKRGGGAVHLSYEDSLPDMAELSPEQVFDRCYANVLVARAVSRLAAEAQQAGRSELFEKLREFLIESPDQDDYRRLVDELGMRRNTIAVAVHRLRSRLKELAREELLDTVADEKSMQEELQVLKYSLSQSGVDP